MVPGGAAGRVAVGLQIDLRELRAWPQRRSEARAQSRMQLHGPAGQTHGPVAMPDQQKVGQPGQFAAGIVQQRRRSRVGVGGRGVRRSRTSSTRRIAEGSVTFAGPGTTRLCTSCQCWLS